MSHPFFEPLEQRQLLSITWVNRGKADSFQRYYGSHAKTARAIVKAAIADWSRAIPGVKARLTITAAPLNGPGNEGTLGETRGTKVYLDRNAAGSGWYFDADLADNTEFADRSGLSQLVGGPADDVDFYSTVLHEVGHALGFSDAKSPFRSGRLRDTNHSDDDTDLMTPTLDAGTRRFISPYDVQHATAWQTATRATAFTASATAGAPQLAVGWTDFYPGHRYKIYRSARPGRDHNRAGAKAIATTRPGVTSFLDTTAEAGRTYYYFVAPIGAMAPKEARAAGSRDDAAALAVQATTAEPRVRLTWTPVRGARYYVIYASLDTTVDDPNLAAVVPAGTTTWTDPASLNGTYRYRVKAVFSPDGRGAGVDFPQPATGRAPGGTGTDDFRVTVGTATGLPELRWSVGKQAGIRDVGGIRIYRAVDTGTADRNVAGATVVADGLGHANGVGNFADATAPIGVPCRYWIVGVVHGKHGFPDTELPIGYSVVATRPDPSAGAGTVRLVHNGIDTDDQREPIQIEWDPVPGATGYTIHITGTNQQMTSHSYSYEVSTGTTAMWGFAGSSRLWVTAWVGGQSVLVGSVVGWMPHGNATTADASGITIRNNWGNPNPQYIDIFRTTSSDDLTSVVPVYVQRMSGSLGSTFVDTTATPGVAYYYWMLDYFTGGGGEWLVIGNGPTVRP